jgi:hypothetical protein
MAKLTENARKLLKGMPSTAGTTRRIGRTPAGRVIARIEPTATYPRP